MELVGRRVTWTQEAGGSTVTATIDNLQREFNQATLDRARQQAMQAATCNHAGDSERLTTRSGTGLGPR